MSEGLVQRAMNNLKKRRQNLLDGKINSIPSPFKRFSNDFIGIEQGCYYLLTSYSKGGKTQFALNLLFEALMYIFDNLEKARLKIFYFNLEETDERIFNRFQSWLLFKLDKIRISPSDLRSSRNDRPLPIKILELLESERYRPYFDFFNEVFTFSNTGNPTGIYKEIKAYAEEHGTVHKKRVSYNENEVFDFYEPDDEFEYRIAVIDHASLVDSEKGMSKKETLDKTSEYLAKELRNKYNITPIVIQQQSTENESSENFKLGRIRPSSAGLSDSKYTARDRPQNSLSQKYDCICIIQKNFVFLHHNYLI